MNDIPDLERFTCYMCGAETEPRADIPDGWQFLWFRPNEPDILICDDLDCYEQWYMLVPG